jgi:hypothetical protein
MSAVVADAFLTDSSVWRSVRKIVYATLEFMTHLFVFLLK